MIPITKIRTFISVFITLTDPITEYTFPKTWVAEEGTYRFEIWMINETWGCDVAYPQDDKFIFDVEIGDYIDLGITINNVLGTSPYMKGDDLFVEGQVTNYGTIDAIDVPLKFQIKEQITSTLATDFVEGLWYDPDTYDVYSDDTYDEPQGLFDFMEKGDI